VISVNIPKLRLAWLLLLAFPAAAGEPLPAPIIARALALAAEAARALAPAGARVLALPGALDGRLMLAPCAQIEPYLATGMPAWGHTRVGLRCTAGPTRWNVFLPVTVQVWAPAMVATAALPPGARLAESQIERSEVDWAAARGAPFDAPQALAGRTLVRAVVAGQAFTRADLQARQWFASGDPVRVVAAGPGYAISVDGVAVTPGVEGQTARVRLSDDRLLVGRATGERQLEVGP
jgi:flagella basal body P-ring formation protein FlgA